MVDAYGDLFGTTSTGSGANFNGGSLEIANTSSGYAASPTVLADFNFTDGEDPGTNLVMDASGDLFGTTPTGETYDQGVVFEIVKRIPVILDAGGVRPSTPAPARSDPDLIFDASGDLFGATNTDGAGKVFEIVKGSSGFASTPTVLASLSQSDGGYPQSGVVADSLGDLFGVTGSRGADGDGGISNRKDELWIRLRADPAGVINGNDGATIGALFVDASGELIGTTEIGGANDDGVLFEIALTSSGYASTPTVLASFNGADGETPEQGLIADFSGDLFGATFYGGASSGLGSGAILSSRRTRRQFRRPTTRPR